MKMDKEENQQVAVLAALFHAASIASGPGKVVQPEGSIEQAKTFYAELKKAGLTLPE
jgi:hypothetical protein